MFLPFPWQHGCFFFSDLTSIITCVSLRMTSTAGLQQISQMAWSPWTCRPEPWPTLTSRAPWSIWKSATASRPGLKILRIWGLIGPIGPIGLVWCYWYLLMFFPLTPSWSLLNSWIWPGFQMFQAKELIGTPRTSAFMRIDAYRYTWSRNYRLI